MNFPTVSEARGIRGVTIVELLVSALLIFVALGSILAMNTRSIHLLRSTRQALASSQMLQQRIESFRDKPWTEVANATALAALVRTPTASEQELADPDYTEFISASVPDALGGAVAGSRSFSVRRERGRVEIVEDGDLSAESMMLFNVTLQWRDAGRPQQRILRTVLCRNGLTRSGVFGSTLGRPAAPSSPPSLPPLAGGGSSP